MKQQLYISEYLGNTDRGRNIAQKIHFLVSDPTLNFEVIEIPNSVNNKNEWCRDYMPVKATDGELVLFSYNPSYLRESKKDRSTIPNQQAICRKLGLKPETTDIILDGGAIEIYGKKAIISDKVLTENTTSWKNGVPVLLDKIKTLLKLDEMVVVPADPWDFTGHVDGMVRFINDDTVLVNDLTGLDKKIDEEYPYLKVIYVKWKRNFYTSLDNAKLNWYPIYLPCTVHKNKNDKSAVGVYMNFLILEKCIVMPVFGDEKNDDEARQILEKAYGRKVFSIESKKLAEEGGIINCVTWIG
ncbi:MAG: agmatine deiminase family protein [Bacteroidales bacterium]|nr:agmatine deiminase family protein [Bacteroidales bacterium]